MTSPWQGAIVSVSHRLGVLCVVNRAHAPDLASRPWPSWLKRKFDLGHGYPSWIRANQAVQQRSEPGLQSQAGLTSYQKMRGGASTHAHGKRWLPVSETGIIKAPRKSITVVFGSTNLQYDIVRVANP